MELTMIAIIDYGMGNLRSVSKGFEKVGHKSMVTREHAAILRASHVVLPGVGAFKNCMDNLTRYGLVAPILEVIEKGTPFLGICLGLQLLFEESEEFGRHKGLGVINGKVVRFPNDIVERTTDNGQRITDLNIPHMGWNSINIKEAPPILKGIKEGAYFYFVHSYYVVPDDEDVVATTTCYGVKFTSSIRKDNIFACQFHPEKSQELGLRILKNFGEL